MGCDGGTIPKRDELVRTRKKPEQKDKASELSFRWRHCSISQQPLQKPIVACQLGRLYSKMCVIEGLLDRSTMPELASHIKTLKDVKDLQLTSNPAFEDGIEKGDGYVDRQSSPFICPVIGLEMNGKFKFCFIWTCGCVMSERSLKEVKTKLCHKCQKPFNEDDIVILNGIEEDIQLMMTRMEARQARLKAEKKAKKMNVKSESSEGGNGSDDHSGIANGLSKEPSSSAATSTSVTATTKSETKLISKLNKSTIGKRPIAAGGEIVDPALKKTKTDYSVAKDPNASSVYKSLFTSHKSAQQQTRAHWITYNPFYN